MKKKAGPIEQRVLHFIRKNSLIQAGQRLVLAVSGGPDSVCLLHVLFALQRELGIGLHIAHLDHQLRGAESEADAEYVTDLARRLNLPASIASRDVRAYRAQKRISLEEAAREVRYAFLSEVVRRAGAACTAVGHTQDDHLETLLMHLVRGSGTGGLRGLQPSVSWQAPPLTVIRPLLEISREETLEYCNQHKLEPRTDATNLSLSPLRNRIRQQLLPLLESYNPAARQALLRTASIAAEDLDFIKNESEKHWQRLADRQDQAVSFDRAGFCALPVSIQRHLLRVAIEKLAGNLRDFEMTHIAALLEATTKPAGKKVVLRGGLVFYVNYDSFTLSCAGPSAPLPPLEKEYIIKIPGETRIPGWRISAQIAPEAGCKADRFTACFDLDKTGAILSVRPRRRGDRFQPLGLPGLKKLGEFMIDARIPRAWRERVPVIAAPHQIIWLAGWRVDERAKVDARTSRVLMLKMERGDEQRGDGR